MRLVSFILFSMIALASSAHNAVRGQQSRDVLLLQASRGLQGPPNP